jgi:predicted RNase H-like HicB family nuclease
LSRGVEGFCLRSACAAKRDYSDASSCLSCPSISGCISLGKTLEEALDNIKEAIEGCLEVMEERVKAISGKQMMEVVV